MTDSESDDINIYLNRAENAIAWRGELLEVCRAGVERGVHAAYSDWQQHPEMYNQQEGWLALPLAPMLDGMRRDAARADIILRYAKGSPLRRIATVLYRRALELGYFQILDAALLAQQGASINEICERLGTADNMAEFVADFVQVKGVPRFTEWVPAREGLWFFAVGRVYASDPSSRSEFGVDSGM